MEERVRVGKNEFMEFVELTESVESVKFAEKREINCYMIDARSTKTATKNEIMADRYVRSAWR